MIDPLVQALMDSGPNDAVWRLGTVTQVSPLLVKLGAATTGQPCRAAADGAIAVNDFVVVLINGPDRVVLGSPTAARAAWGRVASATGGDLTSSGTTVLAITGTASFTGVTGRYYMATLCYSSLMGTLDDIFAVQVRHDSISGTIVAQQRITCQRAASQQMQTLVSLPFTVTAGARALVGCVVRLSGTGTHRSGFADASGLIVEDKGPV